MAKRGRKKISALQDVNADTVDFSDKKKAFLFLFSQQEERIRNSILSDLPAYNALLSMEAESFEEIQLRHLAKNQGIPYGKDTPPIPKCPFCEKEDQVNKKTGYQYRCKACKQTFSVNYNSIVYGSKCDALTWMKLFHCILNFTPISRTCEICGIQKNTYYQVRNRLFYGLQILMDRMKLYGEIQVDNTFVRVSYKGMNLQAADHPEDSVFYEDDTWKPRPGRKRGGSYLMKERNANNICIFSAIDDRGHVLVRFAGIGITSLRSLKKYISADHFLTEVPRVDPFQDLTKPQPTEPKSAPGTSSVMVADKEKAIENFAEMLNLQCETHVYRKDGVQLQLPTGARNIQRVNALHKRLKDFLRDCSYISSKYLPGYLLLFEFIESTGASQRAISQLFEILAEPNLGRSPTYYQEMYSVPNYLLEWLDDDNVLRKLPYNKLLAFYLYDHIREKESYPNVNMTMAYIEKETSYTAPTIRKFYRDLKQAGYREKILRFFGEPTAEKTEKSIVDIEPEENSRTARQNDATFTPIVFAIYDEYAKIRRMPKSQRPSFEKFLDEKNRQYGTNFKRSNMLMKFRKIEESGLREPLPKINYDKEPAGYTVLSRKIKVALEYDALRRSYREKGETIPPRYILCEVLGNKYGIATRTVNEHITDGNKYMREHPEFDPESVK